MKKLEIIKTAALIALAVEGAVMTAQAVVIARNGIEIELTMEELEAAREVFNMDRRAE